MVKKKVLTDEERVRRRIKQLDLNFEDLQSDIDRYGGTFDRRAKIRGMNVSVRVVVRVRAPILQKWAMSIVFGAQGRIDGIDWEATVHDHRGKEYDCSGWHRHMWDPGTLDTRKECLLEFNPPQDVRAFVLEGFKVLKVQLKKGESANAERKLPID